MRSIIRLTLRQARMDFRKRYLGTALGALWALILPLMTIGLIYLVLSYGLKAGAMGHISFINWLVPGMLAWFFMNEAISVSCFAIIESSHLVTKVVFPVQILPISKILSCIPPHLCLMVFFMLVLFYDGTGTVRTWWQLGYYFLCGIMLCISIAFFTSACMVFVRDVSNVINVLLQIFFWATPIFWDPSIVKMTRLHFLLFSPFNYIIQGYRESLFSGVYFWEKPVEMCAFWVLCLFIYFIGHYVFNHLRPNFADIL